MSRRRSERRKLERAASSPADRGRSARGAIPAAAVVAAALLAAICLVPFVVWGSNPYPANAVRYWLWGTPVVLGIGALVALGPDWLGGVVTRARAALDRPSTTTLALISAAIAFTMSAAAAAYMFRFAPTTSDEVAQLWHGRILLEGRWFLPPDPNPEFFALENVIDVGRWYSQFPIGGPLVMTLGAVLGAPWVVNPVFCALAAVGVYHFARRAFGETQGRAIAIVFSLTPMVVFLAGTWMNHVPVLALAMGAFAALVEWDTATSHRRYLFAVLIGACLGAAATIRPIDALILSVVVGVFQLWAIRREPRRLTELVVQGLAGALAVSPLLYANAMTTGDPLRFGYDVMWGAGHNIGFHEDPYGEVHTLGRAFTYAVTYVSKLNLSLEAWPLPVLVLAIVALASMRRVTRWDTLLLALFAVQVAVYASYSLVGELLGPRFLYTAIPTIIILVARLPFLLADRYGDRWGRAAGAVVVACLLIAWCVPTGGSSLNALTLANHTRTVRNNMRVDAAEAVREANVSKAVVVVREPLSSRLLRRMWGVGVPRGTAARLMQSRDACSLLTAVRAVEAGAARSPNAVLTTILTQSTPFVDSPRRVRARDNALLISSPESVTPECAAELEQDDKLPTLLFGPTLPLEPIDEHGRINGDVIYVADLGDRNAILRSRFADRPWYRLLSVSTGDGSYRAELVPY